ncbi:hypothetical protein AB0O42_05690 [Streptomyces sp. NPDC089922]|uniref:hypothetical protein n=1 Tax=Streptomyces sp. NPDC089922 TaxID=3155189 RepID=UPI003432FAC5
MRASAKATLLSEDMARVAYNAHAFIPARGMVKTARLHLGPSGLTATATDGYAIGEDAVLVEGYDGPAEGVTLHVGREGLADLDSAGRKDKKGFGRFEMVAGDGLIFRPANNDTPTAAPDVSTEADEMIWEMLDSLFTRLEERPVNMPEIVAFDPSLLARFAKVKAPKGKGGLGRALDMIVHDAKAPILCRIGPSFRGVIMPIDRDVHAENVGPDGLW